VNDLEITSVPIGKPNDLEYQAPLLEQPAGSQFDVVDAGAEASYANFCRIFGNPEELIMDFGFNSQSSNVPTLPTVINQRIVTGWIIAKNLLQVLTLTIQRHEAAFGVLETDVQKRVQRGNVR
jgi:hypothetical protein